MKYKRPAKSTANPPALKQSFPRPSNQCMATNKHHKMHPSDGCKQLKPSTSSASRPSRIADRGRPNMGQMTRQPGDASMPRSLPSFPAAPSTGQLDNLSFPGTSNWELDIQIPSLSTLDAKGPVAGGLRDPDPTSVRSCDNSPPSELSHGHLPDQRATAPRKRKSADQQSFSRGDSGATQSQSLPPKKRPDFRVHGGDALDETAAFPADPPQSPERIVNGWETHPGVCEPSGSGITGHANSMQDSDRGVGSRAGGTGREARPLSGRAHASPIVKSEPLNAPMGCAMKEESSV